MQVGTVAFFNADPDKEFGFLEVEGKQRRVFFHLSDYREAQVGRDGIVVFASQDASRRKTSWKPRTGDQICFIPVTTKKGVKASMWAPKAEVDNPAIRYKHVDGGNEPQSGPIFRVFTQIGESAPSIDFQGPLSALEATYPRYGDRRQDTLVQDIERDGFDTFKWFERLEDGEWRRVKDPRKMVREKRYHRESSTA